MASFDFVPYEQARIRVRKLKIRSSGEYRKAHEEGKLEGLPKLPNASYRGKGWVDWPHFTGIDNRRNRQYKSKFPPFEEARQIAHDLDVFTVNEYRQLASNGKLPEELPSNPNLTYKAKGWKGWEDFLGKPDHLPYEEARDIARKLNLTSSNEWERAKKRGELPEELPRKPDYVYRNKGWKGWSDFLGYVPAGTLPFEEARKIARTFGITSGQWWDFVKEHPEKLPQGFPRAPQRSYKDKGWKGWGDFLGTE